MNDHNQSKLLSSYESHPEAMGCLGVKMAPTGATYMFKKNKTKQSGRPGPDLHKTQTDIFPCRHLSHPCSKTGIHTEAPQEESDIQDA